MKYYTSTIPLPLAEKLKEKGMPINISDKVGKDGHYPDFYCKNTYAEVFDWLMEKGYNICIEGLEYDSDTFRPFVMCNKGTFSAFPVNPLGFETWNKAAEKAIKKALTLI